MFFSRWSLMFLVSIVGLCSILKITTQTCSNDNEIENKHIPQVMWLSFVVESGDPAFIDAQLANKTLGSNQGLVTSIACGIALVPYHLGYVIQIIIDTVTRNIVAESKPFENFLAGSQILPRYLDSPSVDYSDNILSTILYPISSTSPTASTLDPTFTSEPPMQTLLSSAIMPNPTPPLPPPPTMTSFPNVVTKAEVTSFTTRVVATTNPTMQSSSHVSFSLSSSSSTKSYLVMSSPVPSSSLTTSETQLPSTTAYGIPTTNLKSSSAHIGEIVGGVLGALAGLGVLGGLFYYRRCKKKKPSASDPDPSFMAQHTNPITLTASRPHSVLSGLREESGQAMSLLATEGTVEEPTLNRDGLHFLQQRVDILQQRILQMEHRQDPNMTCCEPNFDDPPPEYQSSAPSNYQQTYR